MCCRYYMEMSPELRPIVEAAQRSRLYRASIEKVAKPLIIEGEVFPDSLVPVIATSKSGEKRNRVEQCASVRSLGQREREGNQDYQSRVKEHRD